MNPPEIPKQKEKQGFFRAIKKKKKKSQPVSLTLFLTLDWILSELLNHLNYTGFLYNLNGNQNKK